MNLTQFVNNCSNFSNPHSSPRMFGAEIVNVVCVDRLGQISIEVSTLSGDLITLGDVCQICDILDVGDGDRCSHMSGVGISVTSGYTNGGFIPPGMNWWSSAAPLTHFPTTSQEVVKIDEAVPDVGPDNTYAGAVRAWRLWYGVPDPSGGYRLRAWAQEHIWAAGVNTATGAMGRGSGHGFYGFNDYAHISTQEPTGYQQSRSGSISGPNTSGMAVIVGSYLGWGHIAVATMGMRARYALPEYVVATGDFEKDSALLVTSDRYGMKMISEEQAKSLRTGLVPYEIPEEPDETEEEVQDA